MSLASNLLEKMKKKGQVKIGPEPLPSPHVDEGEPEPLPSENPVQPSTDSNEDPGRVDQPGTRGPGPLFGGSIEGDQPDGQAITPQSDNGGIIEGIPSDEEMDRIRKPIPILSQYLDGKVVYLVRDEEMAQEIEKQGKVAFTPGEIRTLAEKFPSMDRNEWLLFLKAVCLTKKTFEGSREIEPTGLT